MSTTDVTMIIEEGKIKLEAHSDRAKIIFTYKGLSPDKRNVIADDKEGEKRVEKFLNAHSLSYDVIQR